MNIEDLKGVRTAALPSKWLRGFRYNGVRMFRAYTLLAWCLIFLAMGLAIPCQAADDPGTADDPTYYSLFLDGHKSGWAVENRVVTGDKVHTSLAKNLQIKRGEVPVEVFIKEGYIETLDGKPLELNGEQRLAKMITTVQGRVNNNNKMEVVIKTEDIEQHRTVALGEGVLFVEGLRLKQLQKGLSPGTEIRFKTMESMMLTVIEGVSRVKQKTSLDLLGRVVDAWEVETRTKISGTEIVATDYVDAGGKLLKSVAEIMGMKMEMLACSEKYAKSGLDPGDVAGQLLLKSPKPLGSLKSLQSVVYHLKPNSDKSFQLPAVANQAVEPAGQKGLMLTVTARSLPAGVKLKQTNLPAEVGAALRPTRYVQSDNPEIRKLAEKAVGDATDASDAVRRIEQFVHDYINKKNLSVGYASAVEVAQSREGDCSENAVLTAALCQAAGIPARLAMGYVYTDSFLGEKDIFGGHAWTQVYLGGDWYGLDATRPQGYTAGHIIQATGNGNPEDFIGMLLSGGLFTIDSVEIERK